ncbi:hypothetical protein TUMEXPCC7403_12350 [Tumidithrix helvetica PCC 7403]|uniref:hypothetical protein n=1 Tax=Tumidithrix helvetica TaxID=3457545 RepID=UPI003CB283F8
MSGIWEHLSKNIKERSYPVATMQFRKTEAFEYLQFCSDEDDRIEIQVIENYTSGKTDRLLMTERFQHRDSSTKSQVELSKLVR